ncbi:hypothetical protein J6590_052130 [Homalodisca vitripennis]|nr:hypothetical protein J6590_052130 [Homalodisca vitripennis]
MTTEDISKLDHQCNGPIQFLTSEAKLRRAVCKDRIARQVTHPSSSHARRCLMRLSRGYNRRTRYTASLANNGYI